MVMKFRRRVRAQVYFKPGEWNYLVQVCKRYDMFISEFCRTSVIRELKLEQEKRKLLKRKRRADEAAGKEGQK